ncbi:MAG: hypothetical protein MJ172_02915 [Clostridia bacterium]|nr:hypothetical protein [Clostridia bacterium]
MRNDNDIKVKAELLEDIIGTIDDKDIYDVSRLREEYFNNKEQKKAKVTSLNKMINTGSKIAAVAAALLIVGAIVIMVNRASNVKSSDMESYVAFDAEYKEAIRGYSNSAEVTAAYAEENVQSDDALVEEVAGENFQEATNVKDIEIDGDFPDEFVFNEINYVICSAGLVKELFDDLDIDSVDLTDTYIDSSYGGFSMATLPLSYAENPDYAKFIVLIDTSSGERAIYVDSLFE